MPLKQKFSEISPVLLASITLPCVGVGVGIGECVADVYKWSLAIVGIVAFVQIIYAGWLYLTAFGNTGKTSTARSKIANAILGIILLFSSYLILKTINPALVKGELRLPNISVKGDQFTNCAELKREKKSSEFCELKAQQEKNLATAKEGLAKLDAEIVAKKQRIADLEALADTQELTPTQQAELDKLKKEVPVLETKQKELKKGFETASGITEIKDFGVDPNSADLSDNTLLRFRLKIFASLEAISRRCGAVQQNAIDHDVSYAVFLLDSPNAQRPGQLVRGNRSSENWSRNDFGSGKVISKDFEQKIKEGVKIDPKYNSVRYYAVFSCFNSEGRFQELNRSADVTIRIQP